MNRLLICVLGGVAGYVLFAIATYFAVQTFSSNTHDRAVEAAMTAVFVAGPIGAIAGTVASLLISKS
jgi:ApbE superfamily uncharacterized protein (UPF0280 family)